jgi:hypothetical protein
MEQFLELLDRERSKLPPRRRRETMRARRNASQGCHSMRRISVVRWRANVRDRHNNGSNEGRAPAGLLNPVTFKQIQLVALRAGGFRAAVMRGDHANGRRVPAERLSARRSEWPLRCWQLLPPFSRRASAPLPNPSTHRHVRGGSRPMRRSQPPRAQDARLPPLIPAAQEPWPSSNAT